MSVITPYPPGSLAEYLGDYIGAFSSKNRLPEGERKSEKYSKAFLDILLEKRRQGRL